MNFIEKLKSNIIKIMNKGFFYIFIGNISTKLINFLLTMIIIKSLHKDIYGAYSYANNLLNIILLFNGLGAIQGVLQFCSSAVNSNERDKYFKLGMKYGVISNSIITVIIVGIAIFIKLPLLNSAKYLLLLSFIPIQLIIYQIMITYLRATFKNKEYAFSLLLQSLLYIIFVILLITNKGVIGVIFSRYLSLFIVIIILIVFRKRILQLSIIKQKTDVNISRKVFARFSTVSIMTNAISSFLYLIDVFIIGIIIRDAISVANYKVATLLPFNLNFIPMSLMVFVYPYFARQKKNIKWISHNTKKIVFSLFIFNLVIVGLLILFRNNVILLLFGNQYNNIDSLYVLLLIGYLIAGSIRIPLGNILASLRLVKVNFYNAIISGILNIIIDIILIKYIGIMGAAISTVTIIVISSLISMIWLIRYINRIRL